MRLFDLLCKMDDAAVVWISEDGDEGIYLGEVGNVPLRFTTQYSVAAIYPERYQSIPALGVSIIVQRDLISK